MSLCGPQAGFAVLTQESVLQKSKRLAATSVCCYHLVMEHSRVVDFEKLHTPFIRKHDAQGNYLVTPEIAPGYEWVFEDGVRAVDKLHGTNICVIFKQGKVISVDNRNTRILESPIEISARNEKNKIRFLLGILNSAERGWLDSFADERVYGELIAPEINANLHETPYPLFVPFSYLYDKCHWKSWSSNKHPKDFASISTWFKTINSLFSERLFKKKILAEGVVFCHPDGRMAKLRRDMFDWYEGPRHKE